MDKAERAFRAFKSFENLKEWCFLSLPLVWLWHVFGARSVFLGCVAGATVGVENKQSMVEIHNFPQQHTPSNTPQRSRTQHQSAILRTTHALRSTPAADFVQDRRPTLQESEREPCCAAPDLIHIPAGSTFSIFFPPPQVEGFLLALTGLYYVGCLLYVRGYDEGAGGRMVGWGIRSTTFRVLVYATMWAIGSCCVQRWFPGVLGHPFL